MESYNYGIQEVANSLQCREQRYNSNTFGVDAFSEAVTVNIDSGETPLIHDDYYVYNIGRTQVFAELLFGTKFAWLGHLGAQVVIPGQTAMFPIKMPYYVTAMKVCNKTPSRALVQVWAGNINIYVDREPGAFDANLNRLYREVFSMGIKFVPYVSLSFAGIVGTFWPKDEPNIWQDVLNRVGLLVDEKVVDVITCVINHDVEYYHQRIKTLAEQTNVNPSSGFTLSQYMCLAVDLLGFEFKFSVSQETEDYRYINYILLPLFSHAVLFIAVYYGTCIMRANELMLAIQEVDTIRIRAKRLISGATKYINDMHLERVNNGYETFFAEDIYNNMMNVRTYIAVHGLEYFEIWKQILEEPHSDIPVYNSVISYSQFFGRQTAQLNREAAVMILREPLTPSILSDGVRNRLKYVEIFMWRICGVSPPKIGGLRLTFYNDNVYNMGTQTDENKIIDFGEDTLMTLKVYGRGCVDKLAFYMSDGRKLYFGTDTSGGICDEFEMKEHYIASIFVSSDDFNLGGQAANIAVSFQPFE